MNSSRTLRLALLAASLGAAVAANAITIDAASVGAFTVSGTTATFNESLIYQATNPALATFDSVKLVVDSATLMGTADFKNVAGTQTMKIAYKLSGINTNVPFYAAGGTWTYVSGTGDYANKTGFGTLTQNVSSMGQSSLSTFKGQLQAVPEPASLAALGVGAAGLLRRRRKSA